MPNKTKAIKVTDRKGLKPWLRNKGTNYKLNSRMQNPTILIVCEGQTEEAYFSSFPVYGIEVITLNAQGQTKLKMVQKTIQKVKKDKFDHVYCVFDMDRKNGEQEFAQFDNAIMLAKNNKIEVCYSNDAFELWFYLHYEFTDAKHLRDFYFQFLSKKWQIDYEDDGKKLGFCSRIYKKLLAGNLQETAIRNAKKLFESQQDKKFHDQNPVTTVFQLVEFLNNHLRR